METRPPVGIHHWPARGFCWLIPVLVLGPITYFIDRSAAVLAVSSAIGFGCLSLVLARYRVSGVFIIGTTLVIYYVLNGVAAYVFGGASGTEVINRWIPVFEMYLCHLVAAQARLDHLQTRRLIRWILTWVALRAWLEVLLFLFGSSALLAFPAYSGEEGAKFRPILVISGFEFQRLIDPPVLMFAAAGIAVLLASPLKVRTRFATSKSAAPTGLGMDMRLPDAQIAFLALVVATASIAANFLSLSRAAWLASFVVVVYLLFLRGLPFPWRRLLVPAVLLTLGSLLVYATVVTEQIDLLLSVLYERLFESTASQLESVEGTVQHLRFDEIRIVLAAIEQNPLFGVGVGTQLGTHVVYPDGHTETWLVHNYFLNFFAETGIVGVALLIALAFKSVRWLRMSYLFVSSEERVLHLVFVACLSWYAIFISMHPIYSAYHVPAFLGMLSGLLSSRLRQRP